MKYGSTNTLSIPGPHDVQRKVLANGMVLLCRSNPGSQSMSVMGYVSAGSLLDPENKDGLANFTSLMLMRGNQQRSFQELYDVMESSGISMGYGSSVHTTSFSAKALVEDLSLVLNLLSETMRQPTFPDEYVAKVRTQLLTSFLLQAQDTAEMASKEGDRLLFPAHPYGKPEDGNAETVMQITRDDLMRFHREHYGPLGSLLVMVGGASTAEMMEAAEREFGDWDVNAVSASRHVPMVGPPAENIRSHVTIPEMSQTDINMSTIGPARGSADFMTASLANNILGQFGMMGRIGEAVREKAGLAYYASSGISGWTDMGGWEILAGVNPKNVDKAIELIFAELNKFTQEKVTPMELEDTQSNYIGRMPLMLESNQGVAAGLLNIERYNLGLDYYLRYADLIRQVTAEDILETSRKYLKQNSWVVASAGV